MIGLLARSRSVMVFAHNAVVRRRAPDVIETLKSVDLDTCVGTSVDRRVLDGGGRDNRTNGARYSWVTCALLGCDSVAIAV